MIIDNILDRKGGSSYNAHDFYTSCMEYSSIFNGIGNEIARAMDAGTEDDVRRALCRYVDENEYNPLVKDYINKLNWIGPTDPQIEAAAARAFDETMEARFRALDNEAKEQFRNKTAECFNDIDGLDAMDIESLAEDYVLDVIEGMDIELIDVIVTGSRCRGLETADSDLDIVVEYKGDCREDSLFNLLHEEDTTIGGVQVDFNPISSEGAGTIGRYLLECEAYLSEKKKSMEMEAPAPDDRKSSLDKVIANASARASHPDKASHEIEFEK